MTPGLPSGVPCDVFLCLISSRLPRHFSSEGSGKAVYPGVSCAIKFCTSCVQVTLDIDHSPIALKTMKSITRALQISKLLFRLKQRILAGIDRPRRTGQRDSSRRVYARTLWSGDRKRDRTIAKCSCVEVCFLGCFHLPFLTSTNILLHSTRKSGHPLLVDYSALTFVSDVGFH